MGGDVSRSTMAVACADRAVGRIPDVAEPRLALISTNGCRCLLDDPWLSDNAGIAVIQFSGITL
jgi:hypothetical protein